MCPRQTNLTGDEAAEDVEELEQPVQFLDFEEEEMLEESWLFAKTNLICIAFDNLISIISLNV